MTEAGATAAKVCQLAVHPNPSSSSRVVTNKALQVQKDTPGSIMGLAEELKVKLNMFKVA